MKHLGDITQLHGDQIPVVDVKTHLSLFSGIGGLDIAAEMAGFTTVGQCEIADYPFEILSAHWPNVQKWRDVRTLTKESFYERTGLRSVDVISGGFPCQPHSLIGKRLGDQDDRHLWPEFMRVIRELRPRAVVGENVPGILSTVHDTVCADLEGEGYEVRTFCVPAYAVGAHHERYRVAIVGVAKSKPGLQANQEHDTTGTRREARQCSMQQHRDCLPGTYWAVHKPPVLGMADGLPGGVDGYKQFKGEMTAYGNAVVPQQFYPFFKAISDAMEEANT